MHWDDLGRVLKVPYNVRCELKQETTTNTCRLEAVLYEWITKQPVPVTWGSLLNALVEAKLSVVARKVEEFLCTEAAFQSYSCLPDRSD